MNKTQQGEWKKVMQNRALEKISALLNRTIEAEVKQAYTDIAASESLIFPLFARN